MMFGPIQLNDLYAAEPPITNTFMFRRTFLLSIDINMFCERIILFFPSCDIFPKGSVNFLLYSFRSVIRFDAACNVVMSYFLP